MKSRKKSRKELMNNIGSLKKHVHTLERLEPQLKYKEKELKKFVKTFDERVACRTAAERVVHRQLHSEIEQRKLAEQAIQDALEYANSIVNTIREPLVVLDADLRVISASRSFYQVFKVAPEQTEKRHIYDLGDGQWNIPRLRELLEEILPKTSTFDDFMVEHDFPVIGKRIMLLNAREINQKVNRTKCILLAVEDITERKELEEKLINLATHDELTGCVNFRSLMNLLENEIGRSKRYQKKFCVIMLDLDHFKRINDEYGHLVGNDALTVFADVIKKSIRSIDVVGRYGGDEFMLVLPESDLQHAVVVLERMKKLLTQEHIVLPRGTSENERALYFSAGIAVYPDNAGDLKDLIRFADNELRQAKLENK